MDMIKRPVCPWKKALATWIQTVDASHAARASRSVRCPRPPAPCQRPNQP